MEKDKTTAKEIDNNNWSEAVEDLVEAGEIDAAISLLESVVSELESKKQATGSDPQLVSALTDLAKLYSSKGFSMKADHIHSRASVIQGRLLHCSSGVGGETVSEDLKVQTCNSSVSGESTSDATLRHLEKSNKSLDDALPSSDDDWEAIADRAPDELLSAECLSGISEITLEDTKPQAPKRRGRGTFSYKKPELYSDHLSNKSSTGNLDNEDACHCSEGNTDIRALTYGTHHVLVLADFPPSTGTIELEKLFEDFKDHGVVIRWVNDTTALAVFRNPAIALEARNRVRCTFTVRILDEDDNLISSIPPKDLEPPRQRPKTSAKTAQRLIAQGMGFKLPSSSFGSKELRKQEEDRRNRILMRQKLKDDAWGTDNAN
ncbi:hypothetical protein FNV43_RR17764 [Rhamnella rubrinervis]|uniref:Coiled-coil domain-containing protein R3HCC1L n=1 Tax=Rhamnella rubrinervis TaxID=2594499 RepID=A0A8K0E384_9ROSA|nr:hypothetical protein FNV43_RR17764 [Rhamnella rubrinervis]